MPAGLLVTVPEPLPDLAAVRTDVPRVNEAVAVLLEVTVTVQLLPEAESQPDQLEKLEPAAAVAVKVTTVL